MYSVLSLFDYSGQWAQPWADAGYNVVTLDIKNGIDITSINTEWMYENIFAWCETIDVVLAAPPCTDFASSGAQYWNAKDANGTTAKSVDLVYQILRIIDVCMPSVWVLENPVGRIDKLVPELGSPWYWEPYWYGDAYTKKTGLWGNFNKTLRRTTVKPIRACAQGSWIQALGGKSERTKELRSMTPPGFAKAFFNANDLRNKPTQAHSLQSNFMDF